jgi:nitrate reductase gamma subunit
VNTLLWVVFPYLAVAILIGGLIWRYRYDKFGWTTRSSQLYETAVLRWGSPLFHFGILLVLLGHIGGLLIPKSWTEAVGVSEHMYHLAAVFLGTVSGFCTLIGMAILIARRRLTGPVFAATTKNDKAMYLVLASVIVLGLWATVKANLAGGGYDYRETVSPWLRSLIFLQPKPELMADVPSSFQIHVLAAFSLFAFWPFTRLVHAVSAPVGYVTRPYVVYRSRDLDGGTRGLRAARRGWEPPKVPTRR